MIPQRTERESTARENCGWRSTNDCAAQSWAARRAASWADDMMSARARHKPWVAHVGSRRLEPKWLRSSSKSPMPKSPHVGRRRKPAQWREDARLLYVYAALKTKSELPRPVPGQSASSVRLKAFHYVDVGKSRRLGRSLKITIRPRGQVQGRNNDTNDVKKSGMTQKRLQAVSKAYGVAGACGWPCRSS